MSVQLRRQLTAQKTFNAKLRRENEKLRARVKRLEAEQQDGANCVRALLQVRAEAKRWLKELEPRKYLAKETSKIE